VQLQLRITTTQGAAIRAQGGHGTWLSNEAQTCHLLACCGAAEVYQCTLMQPSQVIHMGNTVQMLFSTGAACMMMHAGHCFGQTHRHVPLKGGRRIEVVWEHVQVRLVQKGKDGPAHGGWWPRATEAGLKLLSGVCGSGGCPGRQLVAEHDALEQGHGARHVCTGKSAACISIAPHINNTHDTSLSEYFSGWTGNRQDAQTVPTRWISSSSSSSLHFQHIPASDIHIVTSKWRHHTQ
jgi:hypothetical protein